MMFPIFNILSSSIITCDSLYPQYFTCSIDQCLLGDNVTVNCTVNDKISCDGPRSTSKIIECQYCWQLPQDQLRCGFVDECKPSPRPYVGYCSAIVTAECLGARTFSSQIYCKSSSGKDRWAALFFSLIFGGFGGDRFYLGYVGSGLAKLFTLGGFGLWSIIDVFLIIANVLRPADGSFYA